MNSVLTRYALYGVLLAGGGVTTVVVTNQRAHQQALDQEKPACCCCEGAKSASNALQSFYDVPAFALTDQSERPITCDNLKGKVWIANFIYTSCPGPCPIMTSRLAKVVKEMPRRDDLRFVSFSVDPDHDTPAVLAKYAKKFDADPNQWFFVTGSKNAIADLSVKGFKLALAAASQPSATDGPIVHSSRVALIDREGRIRGYYDGLDPESLEKLNRDAMRLLDEKPATSRPALTDAQH
jgi:protein SCO1/2